MIHKFEDIKHDIQAAISERLDKLMAPHGEAGFILVDGFFNFPIQSEIGNGFVIGGPSLPMVAIMGKTSNRIFFFPLKVLLPNLVF